MKTSNRSSDGGPQPGSVKKTNGASPLVSVFLCLWFLLVAVGFWGPYFHLDRFAPVGLGLYGVVVLIVAAMGTLRLLRRAEEGRRHVD